ncbi:MAG: hypothetical protein CMD77_06165 [Gammaproteobacteria bacterium]|nr:hypothetical protein [Gammaproteobacteria bacterium]
MYPIVQAVFLKNNYAPIRKTVLNRELVSPKGRTVGRNSFMALKSRFWPYLVSNHLWQAGKSKGMLALDRADSEERRRKVP